MHAVNAVRIPWLRLLNRTKEHFIQTQCIRAILLDNHIWIHHVEHRLRHLLDCPTTNVLAILQDEFGVVIFRTPCLKCLDIQHIVRYDIYIHVERRHVILIFQIIRNKSIRVFDAINKVRTPLNHTLVNQLLEWFFLDANS